MKKAKKIFLMLAFCFTFALAGAAVGCDKGDQGGETSSSSSEESLVSVRFSVPQVEVAQYESVNLDYRVKGTTSAVEFHSSDESIATVDENGRVTAKGVIGNAIITATVDGVSATCTVCVKQSPVSPVLVLGATDYTLEVGETLQFDVAAKWDKEIYTEEIAYQVAVEDGQTVASTVTANGNVITLVGNEAEEFSVILSATVRGVYTSERITVRVVESRLKIRAVNTAFIPSKDGYAVNVSTTDEVGDMTNRVSLDFVVGKGAQILENADISWTIEGDAATLEENEIVGEKSGSVVLNGTATVEGETASVKVVCDVVAPQVHLSDTGVLEVENLKTMTLETELIGNFISAELHGKEVSNFKLGQKISFSGHKDDFPKEARLLGDQVLVLNTDKVRYTMDVTIYTMIINDADELDRMATIANTGATEICKASNSSMYGKEVNSQYYDGYFVLGNDIDYNREFVSMTDTTTVWFVQGTEIDHTRGFKGIFDGMGYNIDGMTIGAKHPSNATTVAGGMFGYLPKEGIVRNVSFTNASVLANNGFICSMGDGTVENVSIQYKRIGGGRETSTGAYGYRAMGSFFTYRCGINATVKNCLIDASAADIVYERDTASDGTFAYDVRLSGTAPNTSNVVVVCPNDELLGYSGGDVQRNNFADMRAESEELFDKFDKSVWTTVDGVPMFVNQEKTLDRDKAISFRDSVEDVMLAGFDMYVTLDTPYATVSIDEIDGVTLTKNVLSATNAAYGKTVTITATSLWNPAITVTRTVYVDSFGTAKDAPVTEFATVYDRDPVLAIGDNTWLWSDNYVYYGKEIVGEGSIETGGIVIDFAKMGYGTKEVTIVRDLDGTREYFTTEITLWYKSTDIADSESVTSAFSEVREKNGYKFTDGVVDPDMEKPNEYFETVTCLNSDSNWSSAMLLEFFNRTPLQEYSDIWVSLKVVNAYYMFQNTRILTDEWVNFHFTQTSNGIWATEVTIGGEVYKVVLDYNATGAAANQLAKLLYRSGISDGFLIYNRDVGVDEKNPTCVYATEIRGVKKA